MLPGNLANPVLSQPSLQIANVSLRWNVTWNDDCSELHSTIVKI